METDDLNFAPPAAMIAPLDAPGANGIFFGRFGFRAGWGMAIFVFFTLIFLAISGAFGLAASGHMKEMLVAQRYAKSHPNAPRPSFDLVPASVIANDGTSFLLMLATCWLFAKAERRKLAYFGISKQRLADFFPGALWGLASLSLLIGVLRATNVLYFDARLLSGAAMVGYAIKWLIAFLFVGFSEEYMLRGYLQYTLTRGLFGLAESISPERARFISFWIAAVIMSLLFGALHLGNGGENAFGISQVVLVGLVFSYALWRTGSLWWAIGFHMSWDWAQSFLYGVPDSGNLSFGRLVQTHISGRPLLSGGVDGPEGSVYCLPIILLVGVIIRFTTQPGPQPPIEQLPPSDQAMTPILASPIA
jgi:membrane protease YdiL (CAAX protease family)